MKLIQLTDIHLTAPGATIAQRDPSANFDRALNHAMENHPDVETIVITGDLSDWGDKDDYERLKQRIATVPTPVELCIGNHDDRETMLSVFPGLKGHSGFVQRTFPVSLGIGIILDTWGQNTHAGHFCEDRAKWFDDTLQGIDENAWVFMHHNPVPTGIGPMDEIMLIEHEIFGDIVAKHRDKIRFIFHGHCHLPLCGSLHGVPFSAPRGTNHAGWPNFGAERLLSGSDLPEAYSVIVADNTSTMVCMVEYGYDGEVRHEGSPDYADWNKLTMIR